jgi:hypothetical protein
MSFFIQIVLLRAWLRHFSKKRLTYNGLGIEKVRVFAHRFCQPLIKFKNSKKVRKPLHPAFFLMPCCELARKQQASDNAS